MLIPYTPLPFSLDSRFPIKRFHGLTFSIENLKGTIRQGKGWSHRVPADYGFIHGTMGADGDEVDCYLGPAVHSSLVFVVDQSRMDDHSRFDEHKVMLGFSSKEEAKKTYINGHSNGKDIFRGITSMSIEELKRWLRKGKRTQSVSG